MNTFLIISVTFLLGVLHFVRAKPVEFRKLFLTQKHQAEIVSIEEVSEEVSMQYYSIKYYHPMIRYRYQVDGLKFEVATDSKFIYRKSSIDAFGNKRKDSDFFWRGLAVGDSVDIIYCKFKPAWSLIVF